MKLKPIRCKGFKCSSFSIGFAYKKTLFLSLSQQQVSIAGQNYTDEAGARRRRASAKRLIASLGQAQTVGLVIDKPAFEDARLHVSSEDDRPFVLGLARRTGEGEISIICKECNNERKVFDMNRVISTELVEILVDNMNANA